MNALFAGCHCRPRLDTPIGGVRFPSSEGCLWVGRQGPHGKQASKKGRVTCPLHRFSAARCCATTRCRADRPLAVPLRLSRCALPRARRDRRRKPSLLHRLRQRLQRRRCRLPPPLTRRCPPPARCSAARCRRCRSSRHCFECPARLRSLGSAFAQLISAGVGVARHDGHTPVREGVAYPTNTRADTQASAADFDVSHARRTGSIAMPITGFVVEVATGLP